ncbi:MAG: ATP-binding cassette domain-containing protein [Deltaproteobacteria bacterium]|nr:MAG: ATP-binding cassette domain-containing protein [Deltaproteobacteria bacterium]TNF24411.1 MAG: ATP-binding cassette domain-containing protein [Deltaproteobacteria bacterium]
MSMISTSGLTKNFKSYKKAPGFMGSLRALYKRDYITKTAVNSFDLTIQKGEIVGLLGPNGAGKTTLMKMFTGIIVPSNGDIKIAGYVPAERDKTFRKKIALVMGQKSQLWWDIPAMDSFLLLQKFYEVPDADFKARVEQMSELLDVKDLLHVHVRKLSLGERMKMELMASLLHNPEVIFLDEPTIGLDLVAQENIRQFIKEYHRQNNTTIILTSHYMADVHALCKRLVLILQGKKGFDGPIEEFEQILGREKSVSFSFSESIHDYTDFFENFSPEWNADFTKVDLRIPMEALREISGKVINKFPVIEFNTEKMPIERVMKTLMEKPELALGNSSSGEQTHVL